MALLLHWRHGRRVPAHFGFGVPTASCEVIITNGACGACGAYLWLIPVPACDRQRKVGAHGAIRTHSTSGSLDKDGVGRIQLVGQRRNQLRIRCMIADTAHSRLDNVPALFFEVFLVALAIPLRPG